MFKNILKGFLDSTLPEKKEQPLLKGKEESLHKNNQSFEKEEDMPEKTKFPISKHEAELIKYLSNYQNSLREDLNAILAKWKKANYQLNYFFYDLKKKSGAPIEDERYVLRISDEDEEEFYGFILSEEVENEDSIVDADLPENEGEV